MRSSAPALIGVFAIIGEGSCFCATVPGLLGRTALGAKKKLKQIHEVMVVKDDEKLTIMEIFSPGRFAELARGFGFESMGSFDLSDGWDWRKPIHRRRAEQILQWSPPDVLVLTPPCGPLSRLQALHPLESRRDPQAFLMEKEMAKDMVRWCLKLAHRQLVLGKHYFFESADGSGAWSLEEMERFIETWNHPQVKVSACAVGLLDKVSKQPFGKKWRIMTSSTAVAAMLEPLCAAEIMSTRRLKARRVASCDRFKVKCIQRNWLERSLGDLLCITKLRVYVCLLVKQPFSLHCKWKAGER